MKQFNELDEKEKKSRQYKKIRDFFNTKNIIIMSICFISAVILAFLWATIYTENQKKQLEDLVAENAVSSRYNIDDTATNGSYTIEFSLEDDGKTRTYTDNTNNKTYNGAYEDLSMEFIGADIELSYMHVYLKISSPNEDTIRIYEKGLYLNGVCVDKSRYFDTVLGGTSSIITVTTSCSDIIANQIGETITEASMRYYFEGEDSNIRKMSDDGFSYQMGETTVLRGEEAAEYE